MKNIIRIASVAVVLFMCGTSVGWAFSAEDLCPKSCEEEHNDRLAECLNLDKVHHPGVRYVGAKQIQRIKAWKGSKRSKAAIRHLGDTQVQINKLR